MNKTKVKLSYVKTKSGGVYALPTHCSQKTFNDFTNFRFDHNDIIVCTHPKSGTTWMMNLIYLIIHKGSLVPEGKHLSQYFTFCETADRDVMLRQRVDDVIPRLYQSHVTRGLFPATNGSKIVCVLRHPKDVCVSYFYHTRELVDLYRFEGNFDDYFPLFVKGEKDYGNYFDHVTEWMTCFNDPNCFNVLYEDMLTDTKSVVMAVACFLGYEHHVTDPDILNRILDRCSFGFMSNNMEKFSKYVVDGKCPVVRRGVIGDWKNHMSKEQAKIIDDKCKEYGIDHLWKKYADLL
uniref:Sulfotransferase n=1 Tax=Phallusia mammillata TaxID=59560 RepID=A0A6F9DTE5_9ASCI|nr:amine sulfotransferase-like [Phallusia mammillata]